MSGLSRAVCFIAGASLIAYFLTQGKPAPLTASLPSSSKPSLKSLIVGENPATAEILEKGTPQKEPEQWTPPVFGENFTDEQRAVCDVMIAKAIRLSDLPIERRSSEKVFFKSPLLGADFGIDCGKWPAASALYYGSSMPPRSFFFFLGAFGAAVVPARQSQVEDLAATCQEKALRGRAGDTIILSIPGGTLQCTSYNDTINFAVEPSAKPVRRSASKGRT